MRIARARVWALVSAYRCCKSRSDGISSKNIHRSNRPVARPTIIYLRKKTFSRCEDATGRHDHVRDRHTARVVPPSTRRRARTGTRPCHTGDALFFHAVLTPIGFSSRSVRTDDRAAVGRVSASSRLVFCKSSTRAVIELLNERAVVLRL